MSWSIINDSPPKGSILVEYPWYYDGGLFWYDPETGETHKRWNDDFYKDRCHDIDEVMQKYKKLRRTDED